MPGMRTVRLASCTAALLLTACGGSTTVQIDISRYGTWLWNGSSWSQLAHVSGSEATTAQGFGSAETLGYWSALGGLVDSDGTRWDGSAWVANASPYPTPDAAQVPDQYSGSAPGERTAMVLDEAENQLVFFDPNSETLSIWSHGAWKQVVSPAQWPKARFLRGAAYDPAHHEVLFLTCCEVGGPGAATETWAWTGQAFVQRPALPDSGGFELVADGQGHLLAFGSSAAFSWDGQSWTSLTSHAALPKGAVDVVRDIGHDQIAAFVLYDSPIGVWLWKGGKWQSATTTPSPPGNCDVSNPVYDPELSGIVITNLPATCEVYALP
jgi:hypothetical protein